MKKIFSKKFLGALFLGLTLLAYSTEAFAWEGERHVRNRWGNEIIVVKNSRYYYRQGRFYRPGWFWFKVAVATPMVVGAVVTDLPMHRRVIIVGGRTYYCCNNIYYRPCPSGYMVVPAPM